MATDTMNESGVFAAVRRQTTRRIATRIGSLRKFAVRRAIEKSLGTTRWGKPPPGMSVRTAFVLYLLCTAAFSLLLFGPLIWG